MNGKYYIMKLPSIRTAMAFQISMKEEQLELMLHYGILMVIFYPMGIVTTFFREN